jgi:hypothetical protein
VKSCRLSKISWNRNAIGLRTRGIYLPQICRKCQIIFPEVRCPEILTNIIADTDIYFSPGCMLYPPACKSYGLEAELEDLRGVGSTSRRQNRFKFIVFQENIFLLSIFFTFICISAIIFKSHRIYFLFKIGDFSYCRIYKRITFEERIWV